MKKLHKFLILPLILIIIVPIILLIIITTTVNPNTYKPQILNLINSKINRTVSIDGDLSWSILPLGINLQDLKVTNDPKFTEEYIITAEAATLEVKIIPLLFKNVEIKTINIDKPVINLSQDKTGYNNWQSIAADNANTSNKPDNTNNTDSNKTTTPSKKLGIAIEKLNITDGTLNWQDINNTINITDLDVELKNFSLDEDFSSPIKLISAARINVNSSQIKTSIETDLSIKFEDSMSNIKLNINKANLDIGGKQFPRQPHFYITNSSLDLDLEEQSFNMTKLNADLSRLYLNGNLSGSYNYQDPSLNGNITISDSDIDDFLNNINLETVGKSYEKLQGNISFKTSNKIINIDPIDIKLDQDNIQGTININSQKLPYKVKSNLNINQLNLDRLTISKSKVVKTSSTEDKSSTETSKTPTPVIFSQDIIDTIGNLELDLSAKINKLIISSYTVNNINTHTAIAKKTISNNASFSIYKGSGSFNNKINLNKSIPNWQGNLDISNFEIASLLKEQLDTEKLSGNSNFKFNYTTSGNDSNTILNNISGNLSFNLTDGALAGLDLVGITKAINSKLSLSPDELLRTATGLVVSIADSSNPFVGDGLSTKIAEMSATGTINNGIITNKDLLANLAGLNAYGSGQVNLPANTINYLLTLKGHGKNDIELPINISGNLSSPEYSVDATAFLGSNFIKSLLNKNIDEIKDLPKNLPKKIEKNLKDIKNIFDF